jgi:MGT family glycosyltransferase
MTHFAVTCPESPGHINPMTTLLVELQRRGHEVTWIGLADFEERVQQQGFQSIVIGEKLFPRGAFDRLMGELGRRSGLSAARYTLHIFHLAARLGLEEGIRSVQECGATALISDETVFTSRTCAEMCGLPWVTVCNALPICPDIDLPPNGLPWRFKAGAWARARNAIGYQAGRIALGRIIGEIRRFRKRQGLCDYNILWENTSRLATLAQISSSFDFPRANLPDWFHYVGALHDVSRRDPVDFPFEQLDGRPLIYASMGTAQNRLLKVFHTIAEACRRIDAQLVISLGGGVSPDAIGHLEGNPIVVKFAPQLELIERAALVITHAGMNTVAESIAAGVPMVAIPVTNDQPSVAARVQHHGCGEVVPLWSLSARRLSRAVNKVMNDPSYAERTRRQAGANKRAGGAARAADIIESAIGERT